MYRKKTAMNYRPGRKTATVRLSVAMFNESRRLKIDLNKLFEQAMLKEINRITKRQNSN